jgi:hypothetical protein
MVKKGGKLMNGKIDNIEMCIRLLTELEVLHRNFINGMRIRLMDYERGADDLLKILNTVESVEKTTEDHTS